MADEILPNLGIELPDIGLDQDTWGDITNENWRIVDNAVAYDVIAKTLSNVDVTLTAAEAASAVIDLSGTLTANVNVIVPASPVRLYLVRNQTSGAFTVTVKTAAGMGTSVAQGFSSLVYSDGTNIIQGATSINGSFNLAAGTANGVAYLNGSKVLTTGAGLVFDGSNLGLGQAPSAWNAGVRALQVGATTALATNGDFSRFYNNGYIDSAGTERYLSSDFASFLNQVNGQFQFFTAPSGTAGNPITFTQAMTLTQGGNLLVGTTSDSGRVTVGVNAGDGTQLLTLRHESNVRQIWAHEPAGNARPLEIKSQQLVFRDDVAERARITSGGYFKASNTGSYNNAAAPYHELRSNANDAVLVLSSTNSGSGVSNYNSQLPSGAAGVHANYDTNGANVYRVLANGNVQNTNNSYGAISDRKLKENITDASSYLDRFMQVRFRDFNFIGSDLKQFGVIAQELEQVFPGLVDESPDMEQVTKTRTVDVPAVLDEEGNEVTPASTREEEYTESVPTGTFTKSVKYSVLALMAGKVIQEQQAMIQSLIKRIEALEAK